MTIYERMEALQKKTGKTVLQLRREIGISTGAWYYLRNGEREPTLKMLHRLEKAEREAGLLPKAETSEMSSTPAEPPKIKATSQPDITEQLAELKIKIV